MIGLPRSGSGTPPSAFRPPSAAVVAGAGAVAALLLGGLLLGQQAEQKPGPEQKTASQPAQQTQAPATPAATYVGSESCQPCHEDIYKAFARNAHQAVETDKKRGWEGKACESCHGPGSKHAESTEAADIINPAKIKPADADRSCLKCHFAGTTHTGRIRGGHAKNQVSCTGCHAVHKRAEDLHPRKAQTKNQLCRSCHTGTWAEFTRPHNHPVPEGAMSCTDCHDPHGSTWPASQRMAMSNDRGCLKCHGDKRGPFTFEHAPVRLEGCRTCHEPHGSANPHMLTRQEVRFVCLECHANIANPATAQAGRLGGVPPAFHDLRSPRYRNCTICHVKVHGSYVNRSLLR